MTLRLRGGDIRRECFWTRGDIGKKFVLLGLVAWAIIAVLRRVGDSDVTLALSALKCLCLW